MKKLLFFLICVNLFALNMTYMKAFQNENEKELNIINSNKALLQSCNINLKGE